MKLIDEYNGFLGTLKDISKDNRDKGKCFYLIDDETKEHRLINFDSIKKYICRKCRGDENSSCDGYIEKKGKRYLIEFKNQSEGNIDKTQIRNKAFDSISLLLINEGNITREKLSSQTILIIVYNNKEYEKSNTTYVSSNSYDKIVAKLKSFTMEEGKHEKGDIDLLPKKFGLEHLVGIMYNDVFTVDMEVFKDNFG